MKSISAIQSIYFIGIGGIGMSALARYFNLSGVKVSGYDKTPTALTDALIKEGVSIHFEDNIELIPANIDLVVYTPAIPSNHQELVHLQQSSVPIWKRSDLLKFITDQSKVIAVAGTHGKTTTSSMIAHILKHSGFDCTAFLGGITANYNTNFLVGKNEWVVVEADEYDRSFLKLFPTVAVITAVDPDHLDIYKGGVIDFENTFVEFASQVKSSGKLFVQKNIPILSQLASPTTYAISGDANIRALSVRFESGTYHFDISIGNQIFKSFELNVHGSYNIENALAAIAVAFTLNIEEQKIKAALKDFRGVKRRFEYIVKNEKVVYIDDYAHHPNELTPFLSSVRKIYPDKKITVVFQPHLFSRTKDFAEGFANSLGICDELILLPIYPARELPIAGITSEALLSKIAIDNKSVVQKENLMVELQKRKFEVLCTVGAGDIDAFVQPIKQMLTHQ